MYRFYRMINNKGELEEEIERDLESAQQIELLLVDSISNLLYYRQRFNPMFKITLELIRHRPNRVVFKQIDISSSYRITPRQMQEFNQIMYDLNDLMIQFNTVIEKEDPWITFQNLLETTSSLNFFNIYHLRQKMKSGSGVALIPKTFKNCTYRTLNDNQEILEMIDIKCDVMTVRCNKADIIHTNMCLVRTIMDTHGSKLTVEPNSNNADMLMCSSPELGQFLLNYVYDTARIGECSTSEIINMLKELDYDIVPECTTYPKNYHQLPTIS